MVTKGAKHETVRQANLNLNRINLSARYKLTVVVQSMHRKYVLVFNDSIFVFVVTIRFCLRELI